MPMARKTNKIEVSEQELHCIARMLKSAIESGGWLTNECEKCPYCKSCRTMYEDNRAVSYKNEYIMKLKLLKATGIDVLTCTPYVSESLTKEDLFSHHREP